MNGKLKNTLWVLLLVVSVSGCRTPADLFSWLDRNCFVADWTNHHSCVSCCNCKHGSCQRPPQKQLPMLELGNPPATQATEPSSTASNAMAAAFDVE